MSLCSIFLPERSSEMTHNLPNYSHHIFGRICKFLPKASILQLRKSCKSLDESVCNLASSIETTVNRISISSMDVTCTISLVVLNNRERFMWKLYFYHVHKVLDVAYPTCLSDNMLIMLPLYKMQMVLGYMRKSNITAKIEEVHIGSNINTVFGRAFTNFLENKVIGKVAIGRQDIRRDRATWQHLAAILRFEKIVIESLLGKEDLEFIFRLSDVAQSLCIFIERSLYTSNQYMPIIRYLLSRKCSELDLVFEDFTIFTALEAEKLINTFSQMEKRVKLSTMEDGYTSNAAPIDIQVGKYRINCNDRLHLEIKPLL